MPFCHCRCPRNLFPTGENILIVRICIYADVTRQRLKNYVNLQYFLTQVRTKLHENVLENLKKLSFTSSGKQSKKPSGASKNRKNKRPFAQGNKKHDTDFHFSNSGRLVAGRQLVYLIDDELGKDQV